jgi:hypothetical protein
MYVPHDGAQIKDVTVHPVGQSFGLIEPALWAAKVRPKNSSVFRPCNRSV